MTPAVTRVYERLIEAAQRGDPCPTGHMLGAALGIRDTQAHQAIRSLRDLGLIHVEFDGHARRVTVTASGDRTGWTDTGQFKNYRQEDDGADTEQRRSAAMDAFEAALQRSGRRFVDATTVAPPGVLRRLAPQHHSPTGCAFAHLARSG